MGLGKKIAIGATLGVIAFGSSGCMSDHNEGRDGYPIIDIHPNLGYMEEQRRDAGPGITLYQLYPSVR